MFIAIFYYLADLNFRKKKKNKSNKSAHSNNYMNVPTTDEAIQINMTIDSEKFENSN